MSFSEDEIDWSNLSESEKKQQLFIKQKKMLDQFLETGAISQNQYDTSLNGLITKMGITDIGDNTNGIV